jgi:hypothetical protein
MAHRRMPSALFGLGASVNKPSSSSTATPFSAQKLAGVSVVLW